MTGRDALRHPIARGFATAVAVGLLAWAMTFTAGAQQGGRPAIPPGGKGGTEVLRTGSAPQTEPLVHAPAPGWTGEKLFSKTGNDWEPDAAADPGAPYVVALTTRYNTKGMACKTCPYPYIMERVSSDGGVTFGAEQYICTCMGRIHGQYDPQITADAAGNFYAAWIQGRNIVFTKSTDHGGTWAPLTLVSKPVPWADHPWIFVSSDGLHVYLAFNHADSWIAVSHDGGTTWDAPVLTGKEGNFHYAGGGYADVTGNAVLVDEAFAKIGGKHKYRVDAYWTDDGGATWHVQLLDTGSAQTPPCVSTGCYRSFYGGHAAVAGDDDGKLVVVYDVSKQPFAPERVFIRTSPAIGAAWSPRKGISPLRSKGGPRVAAFPAIAATGSGDFRLWYQENSNGMTRWNTIETHSLDAGATWSSLVRISDAISGTAYKGRRGFWSPYGDYGEMTITNTGKSFAIWGEGKSYWGPGGTWYNLST